MTYKLTFVKSAEKEWRKLGATLRDEFLGVLANRLDVPHVPSARLRGLKDCYKIKLRSSGYRLVYRVYEDTIEVRVIGVGRRDGKVYDEAAGRQDSAAVNPGQDKQEPSF